MFLIGQGPCDKIFRIMPVVRGPDLSLPMLDAPDRRQPQVCKIMQERYASLSPLPQPRCSGLVLSCWR